jgi:hypothetical protein
VALLFLAALAVRLTANTDPRQDEVVWRDPMGWLARGGRPPVRASDGSPTWVSIRPGPSHVFVVDSFPVPDSEAVYHEGLDSLLSLLADNDASLYRSDKHLAWCDTAGLIARDDVVLIKVNTAYPERGMTNTDIIKGLIGRIVAHPDTFVGEIDLVENGQGHTCWTYSLNNAERQSQTMQSVVDLFAGQGYRVGDYDWSAIGHGDSVRWVSEFDVGDTVSGYVREDSTGMTYPKFVTAFGTSVSTRLGVWNDSAYEPRRLKFVNLPVLKSHTGMGVTAAVKNYVGFLSYAATGPGPMHDSLMTQGLLGIEFGKARFPDLNIVDATWVCAEIATGPTAPYGVCTRLNTLIASRDPIAADYYAGRYVIKPASWWNGRPWLHDYGRMDPDNLNTENPGGGMLYSDSTPCHGTPYNAFHQILTSSRDQLLRYGRQVTMDSLQMTVHGFHFPYIAEGRGRTLSATGRLLAMPNPATSEIKVRYRLDKPGAVRLKVFSSDGRMVDAITSSASSPGEHHLDVARSLAPGTYLLSLETPDGPLLQSIVVPVRWVR